MSQPSVAIVGAGIIGVSCAAFLQREGFAVTLIDRVPPGEGCSFGNAAGVVACAVEPTIHPRILTKIPGWLLDPLGPLTIRWSYLPKALPWLLAAGRQAMPDRVRFITEARAALGLRAVADFKTLLGEAKALDLLHLVDGLKVFETEAQWRADEQERTVQARYGYPWKRLTTAEMRELEPDLAPSLYCGRFHGGWHHVSNPYRTVRALADLVIARGGTVIADDVADIEREGERVSAVMLKGAGRLPVERLVIAAGAYSMQLAGKLGARVRLEAERGYHLTIPDPGVSPSRVVTLAGKPGAITPLDVGLRIAGTDEFAGLDAPPDWRRADVLWHMGRAAFPALRPLDDTVERWMGRRPGTPDGLPVIDRAPDVANAWLAFGHSHMGLSWGPTTGRLISELIAGKPGNMDMTPFAARRA
jgi:D-amino-acid dehydrogenase